MRALGSFLRADVLRGVFARAGYVSAPMRALGSLLLAGEVEKYLDVHPFRFQRP